MGKLTQKQEKTLLPAGNKRAASLETRLIVQRPKMIKDKNEQQKSSTKTENKNFETSSSFNMYKQ